MGMARIRKDNLVKLILKNSGQALVEYLLLLVVIVSVVIAFFKSQIFLNYFGANGTLADGFKKEIEYSYRHASRGRAALGDPQNQILYSNGSHPSFWNAAKGTSHFFGPREPYPAP
jgi:hypothetical protein